MRGCGSRQFLFVAQFYPPATTVSYLDRRYNCWLVTNLIDFFHRVGKSIEMDWYTDSMWSTVTVREPSVGVQALATKID